MEETPNLIILIEKDIEELALLVEGLHENGTLPAPILTLCIEKTRKLYDHFSALERLKTMSEIPIVSPKTPKYKVPMGTLVEEALTEEVLPIFAKSETVVPPAMDKKTVGDRQQTLNNKKIQDVKQALSIGDRFRFEYELFESNGKLMSDTIAQLNELQNYEEALTYLSQKFNWKEDNPHVEDFLHILQRRYS